MAGSSPQLQSPVTKREASVSIAHIASSTPVVYGSLHLAPLVGQLVVPISLFLTQQAQKAFPNYAATPPTPFPFYTPPRTFLMKTNKISLLSLRSLKRTQWQSRVRWNRITERKM